MSGVGIGRRDTIDLGGEQCQVMAGMGERGVTLRRRGGGWLSARVRTRTHACTHGPNHPKALFLLRLLGKMLGANQ